MRPIMFFILLYLMSALESARLGALALGRHEDWPVILFLPMLAVFYALFSAEPMPLTALACGLLMDLTRHELIGTNMVPLALVAWLIAQGRRVVIRDHAIAQMIITLVALLLFAAIGTFYRKVIGSTAFENDSAWSQFGSLVGDAFYTALISPAVFWVYFRFTPLLGFSAQRSRRN